jgi:hypothetical protein
MLVVSRTKQPIVVENAKRHSAYKLADIAFFG